MTETEILYLNPNYLIRHDETRSLLCARHENDGNYSKGFFSFIHPYYAELLALFNGGNTIEEVISTSYLGNKFGRKIIEFINKITENEKSYKVEWGDTQFLFPKNLLLRKSDDCIIDKNIISTDFSFKNLDFKTSKLNFPIYITYMINTVCYTDCIYCYADCRMRKKRQLSIKKVMELLDEIEETPILDFTIMGGEFLLDENWEMILSRLHQLNLFPVISTKIPISEDIIRRLKKVGVKKIQISLDSINPKVLSRLLKVDGEKYLLNMRRTLLLLKEYGIRVKINSVFTHYNCSIDELSKLLDFFSEFSVDSVTVIPAGISMYKSLEYMPSEEAINSITEYIEKVKDNYNYTLSMPYAIPKDSIEGTALQKDKYFTNRSLCTGNLWQAFIMPNGDVTFCEGTMSHPSFVLGNICDRPFREVWKTTMLQFLNQDYYNKSACGNCPDFESCHTEKGVCWKYIIQGYGGENVYYPDPRCPKALALKNRIY